MKEVDKKINLGHVDDYNKVLKVYQTPTESVRESIKSDLEYIIEKAALPVNKHKNSRWVDDSYNLIGKARLYQKEYKLAIETFKYVNTKSKEDDARHTAMIHLLKTYLDTIQIENAKAVNDFLKKENITPVNAADLYLTRAELFRMQEDYDNMKVNLEESLPYIKLNETKARIYFILGQIYQLQGDDQKAYENYSQVFKKNPPYELFFYARLYLAQVSNLEANSDRKKIDKYFKKLLKDQKNLEYRDKIYYEMGKYELKQNDLPKAITNFKESLKENKGNPFQKARTYLALGEVYYEKLNLYRTSKLYYDSTVSLWDPIDKDFESISDRQKILEEFVHYYEIVQKEDSLQKLAKMNEKELNTFLDNVLTEKAKREQELALQKAKQEEELKNRPPASPEIQRPLPNALNTAAEWYFYNSSTLALGRVEFSKKWGKRKLEDNWRRSKKQSEIDFNDVDETPEIAIDNEKLKQDSLLALKAEKERMRKDIPYSQAAIDSSNMRIEDGLYNLGKIYTLKLNEQPNSIETFNSLLTRYPQTELKPETYYFLYLIYKNQNSDEHITYRNKLNKEFPNSLYAKIIDNPNYLAESKILNQQAGALYSQAFELHKQGLYIASDSLLETIKVSYPDNDIQDKLVFLGILNKGKTQNPLVYRNLLEKFSVEFSSSTLSDKAEELLATTNSYIDEQRQKGINVESQVKFVKNFERPHGFVCLVKNKNIPGIRLKDAINRYNGQKGLQLTPAEMVSLSDSTTAVYLFGFNDQQSARTYMKNVCEKDPELRKYDEQSVSSFIITNENFKILEQSGNSAAYLKFFRMNYHETLIYGE